MLSNWDSTQTDDFWEKQEYGVKKYRSAEGYNGYAWYWLDDLRLSVGSAEKKVLLRLGAIGQNYILRINWNYLSKNRRNGRSYRAF
jgi:hypothetical protein